MLHDAERGVWLRFDAPREVIAVHDLKEVVPALARVGKAVSAGVAAVGFVAYEAAPALDPALKVRPDPDFPLLWFALFDTYSEHPDLPSASTSGSALPEHWIPTLDAEAYAEAMRAVKTAIREGETYQINLTYRIVAECPPSPWKAFLQLAEAQRCAYGAYLEAGDWILCSASPELFLQRDDRTIASRPMKGTAARGPDSRRDLASRDRLLASEKERAEHLMIVDMVRNDLGRVADPGSVQVPDLLTAERYPTVWQLTSTVRATTDATLPALFQALFPPASITGAPKRRTMELIAALENTPRRVYTGTIGFLLPGGRAQFNVAIRTLLCNRRTGRAEYGVGGGIVWDSETAAERRECELKARILSTRHPDFDLLETLLWTSTDGFALLERHLDRLARSAEYFGYRCERAAVLAALQNAVAELPQAPHRIRLLAARRGGIQVTVTPLDPDRSPRFADPVLDLGTVDSADPFLYHKTTHRQAYGEALARNPGATDVLLRNERGQITEGTLANLVYAFHGRLWTPPVDCGLLAGTCRASLLDAGRIRERPLHADELAQVTALFFANSVRGVHRIRLRPASA